MMILIPDIYDFVVVPFLDQYDLWRHRGVNQKAYQRWSQIRLSYLTSKTSVVDALSNDDPNLFCEIVRCRGYAWVNRFVRTAEIDEYPLTLEASGGFIDILRQGNRSWLPKRTPRILDVLVSCHDRYNGDRSSPSGIIGTMLWRAGKAPTAVLNMAIDLDQDETHHHHPGRRFVIFVVRHLRNPYALEITLMALVGQENPDILPAVFGFMARHKLRLRPKTRWLLVNQMTQLNALRSELSWPAVPIKGCKLLRRSVIGSRLFGKGHFGLVKGYGYPSPHKN